jgi:hypothetical protein
VFSLFCNVLRQMTGVPADDADPTNGIDPSSIQSSVEVCAVISPGRKGDI